MIRAVFRATMAATLALGAVLSTRVEQAQAANEKATLALTNTSMTFAYAYIADALGFWKQAGLDVDVTLVNGTAATAALLGGDIDFVNNSGLTVLTAHARHQDMTSIAGIFNSIPIEIVISAQAAAKTGLTVAGSTVEQRARALKGMTLAPSDIGSVLDDYVRYVLKKGGLDPDKDATITPVIATADLPAMKAGRIDGFVQVPPWTTVAEQQGLGVIWISSLRGDLPEFQPFAYNTISTRAGYCDKNPDICSKLMQGVQRAFAFMKSDPEKSLEILDKKFNTTDPGLVKTTFEQNLKILAPNAKLSEMSFANAQKFGLDTGDIKPGQEVKQFEGTLFTDRYADAALAAAKGK